MPEELKSILHSSLVEMSLGMQYFLENSDSDELVLKSHRDLNQYCYFVAGLVGTYLNESYRYFYGKDLSGEKPTLDLLAIQFGLFLQKVNVLKDQLEDEKIGRKLISDREEVVDSLLPLAEKSFQYIKSISENLSGYRLFCAWSFFLGLASLPFVQKSFRERKEIKLPRIQAWKLLNRVKSALVDNFKLNEIYLELIEPIKSLAEIKNNCIDKKAANEEKHGKRISSDESTNSVVALLKLRYERFLNIKNPSSLSYREFESLGL